MLKNQRLHRAIDRTNHRCNFRGSNIDYNEINEFVIVFTLFSPFIYGYNCLLGPIIIIYINYLWLIVGTCLTAGYHRRFADNNTRVVAPEGKTN